LIFGEPLTRKIEVWVTDQQHADLQSVAASEKKSKSALIRDAVDSYVGDFRDEGVFRDDEDGVEAQ
jgi:hypothetical protein